MRLYYYLLFRIYMFYRETLKEKDSTVGYTSTVASIIIIINVLSIYYLLLSYFLFEDVFETYLVVLLGVVFWIANYFIIKKKKIFIDYNFKRDKKGGIVIVSFLLFTIILFIIAANINRSRILV